MRKKKEWRERKKEGHHYKKMIYKFKKEPKKVLII